MCVCDRRLQKLAKTASYEQSSAQLDVQPHELPLSLIQAAYPAYT